ncbi:hypothetical protein FGO68_gene15324 [Halteria grandinella]|uniref:Uncharacterized protein n=1 Tax=Halteria grandinella TaxID=5974 RepID=A0A8J8NEH4_HALGN|nr:hypothetical protein FGO68_gene15324 [Halteria grandinella]
MKFTSATIKRALSAPYAPYISEYIISGLMHQRPLPNIAGAPGSCNVEVAYVVVEYWLLILKNLVLSQKTIVSEVGLVSQMHD